MPTNSAAWMMGPKQRLKVKGAPYPKPGPGEIVVRNRAVAINPIDWILQTQGTALGFSWIKYPFIFGNDVAGEVVQAGEQVSGLQVGDRVTGQAHSVDKTFNSSAYGGFQQYTILLERNAASIPQAVSFESASVIPLGFATAAAGLFEKDQLNLEYPQLKATTIGKTLLIWGGSTSVGMNAIQLAVAAGYEVMSTSSPRNFDLLKSLGASEVFDYNDPKVVDDIVQAVKGRISAGAMAIGENSSFRCLDVMARVKGNKHIALATLVPQKPPKRFVVLRTIFYIITSMISIVVRSKLRGIPTSFVYGSVAHSPVGEAVYAKFLPDALASGKFKAAPEPIVAGEGLEAIQKAIDLQMQGVSARKVVVSLK